jgi:hypothetical protein
MYSSHSSAWCTAPGYNASGVRSSCSLDGAKGSVCILMVYIPRPSSAVCVYRIVDMPFDFATTRLAGVTQAILDGPLEDSLYDSIILETVAELRDYCPLSLRQRAGSTGA